MPDLSMNTGVKHEPRTVALLGFDNVHGNVASTEKATVPYEVPAPLVVAVTATSNTQQIDFGPAAGEITRRTRNG